MCTPNKKAKSSQHLTPCRRMGLRRSVHNFTPPFKGNDLSSPNILKSTSSKESPAQSSDINKCSLECKTPIKSLVKANNKRLFKDEPDNSMTSTSKVKESTLNEEITESQILRKKKEIAIKKMKLSTLRSQDISADELKVQISLWKAGCRDILEELLDATKSENSDNRNENILKLLNGFNIPCELIGYDPVSEEFICD